MILGSPVSDINIWVFRSRIYPVINILLKIGADLERLLGDAFFCSLNEARVYSILFYILTRDELFFYI